MVGDFKRPLLLEKWASFLITITRVFLASIKGNVMLKKCLTNALDSNMQEGYTL